MCIRDRPLLANLFCNLPKKHKFTNSIAVWPSFCYNCICITLKNDMLPLERRSNRFRSSTPQPLNYRLFFKTFRYFNRSPWRKSHMPIRIQSQLPAIKVLEEENIFVMTHERAISQDIRPVSYTHLDVYKRQIKSRLLL